MKFYIKKTDFFCGMFVYAIADTIATFILGKFDFVRLIGMLFVGGVIYASEIPLYFKWLEKNVKPSSTFKRALFSVAYFNPLWIMRHLFFIALFSAQWDLINWKLLAIASYSFIIVFPVGLTFNYILQNKIPLKWRFISSATYSGLMAIYYALSRAVF